MRSTVEGHAPQRATSPRSCCSPLFPSLPHRRLALIHYLRAAAAPRENESRGGAEKKREGQLGWGADSLLVAIGCRYLAFRMRAEQVKRPAISLIDFLKFPTGQF